MYHTCRIHEIQDVARGCSYHVEGRMLKRGAKPSGTRGAAPGRNAHPGFGRVGSDEPRTMRQAVPRQGRAASSNASRSPGAKIVPTIVALEVRRRRQSGADRGFQNEASSCPASTSRWSAASRGVAGRCLVLKHGFASGCRRAACLPQWTRGLLRSSRREVVAKAPGEPPTNVQPRRGEGARDASGVHVRP